MSGTREFVSSSDKAFAFAQDATKILITLATGVLALTVTFSEQVLQSTSSNSLEVVGAGVAQLVYAWLLYAFSIFFGLWGILAMTGVLGRTETPTIYAPSIRLPCGLQIITFIGGTAFLVWAGINTLVKIAIINNLCPIWPFC